MAHRAPSGLPLSQSKHDELNPARLHGVNVEDDAIQPTAILSEPKDHMLAMSLVSCAFLTKIAEVDNEALAVFVVPSAQGLWYVVGRHHHGHLHAVQLLRLGGVSEFRVNLYPFTDQG